MSWSLVSLGSLCHKITDGSHNPPKGISNSEYLMLSSKNVFHNEINFKNPRYLTREDFKKENKRTDVCENDVLLTIVGTIGRVAVISRNNSKFTLQRSVAVLKPKLELITSRFLMYTLRNLTSFLERSARGVAQKGIYLKQIRELKIPLPPLAEQQKIAAILDAADQLRQKDQQLIDHYTTLSQSLFLEMFGDPVSNDNKYEIVSLGDITSKVTDGVHAKPEYTESGIPFISVKDVTTGVLTFDKCKYISESAHAKYYKRCNPELGDIIYTKVGATYGRAVIVDVDFQFSLYVSVALIKPIRELINPIFLKEAMINPAIKRQADRSIKGIGVPDLHLNMIRKFTIPLPPISLQNQFAQHIEKIEQQKQYAQASLKKSETLFNSLLQRAFKGELTPTQP